MKSIELSSDTHFVIFVIFLILSIYCLTILPNAILQLKLLGLGMLFGLVFATLWISTLRKNPNFFKKYYSLPLFSRKRTILAIKNILYALPGIAISIIFGVTLAYVASKHAIYTLQTIFGCFMSASFVSGMFLKKFVIK